MTTHPNERVLPCCYCGNAWHTGSKCPNRPRKPHKNLKRVRQLHLERDQDVSGISGTGVVAYGVEFPDDTIVLRWDTTVSSTVIYNNVADLEEIVGHGGKTRIVFDD